jgi:hypothetical protein
VIDLRGDRLWDPSEGEYEMILTLSFLAVFMSLVATPSMSKVNGECSTSMAAMVWAACALRKGRGRDPGGSGAFNFLGSREGDHPDFIKQWLLT